MPLWSDFNCVQRWVLVAVAIHAVLYVLVLVFGDDLSMLFIITQPLISLSLVTSLVVDARPRKRDREARDREVGS